MSLLVPLKFKTLSNIQSLIRYEKKKSNERNSKFGLLHFGFIWILKFFEAQSHSRRQLQIVSNDFGSFFAQIKTTSPEKFRVRPSTGILLPGNSATINVVLQSGPNVTLLLNKDKFLVMCMEMKDLNASQQDIAEIWKVRHWPLTEIVGSTWNWCIFFRAFVEHTKQQSIGGTASIEMPCWCWTSERHPKSDGRHGKK